MLSVPVYLNEPIFSKKKLVRRMKVDMQSLCMLNCATFNYSQAEETQLELKQLLQDDLLQAHLEDPNGAVETFSSDQLWMDYFAQMNSLNQILSLSMQLKQDINLSNHKYIAHQLALLFQCLHSCHFPALNQPFKRRIEERFQHIKSVLSVSEPSVPLLDTDTKRWLEDLTTDLSHAVLNVPASSKSRAVGIVSDFLANEPFSAATKPTLSAN